MWNRTTSFPIAQNRVTGQAVRGCAAAIAFFLMVACGERSVEPTRSIGPTAASQTISDGAHGGSSRVYFLPPLVPHPTYSGTFDASAFGPNSSDQVYVCVLAGSVCGNQVATFGPGGVQMDPVAETYQAIWHTSNASLDPANTYRVVVVVKGQTLAYADIVVLTTGAGRKSVDPTQFVSVIAGTTLAITFRLETAGNLPPHAAFTFNCTDLTCTFDSGSSTDDVGITSRSWDFGDATPGDVVVAPQHTFASAGTYTVTLSVEDGGGLSDASSQQVVVTAPPLSGMIAVNAGGSFSCSLSATAALYCWGVFPNPPNHTLTPTIEVPGLQAWVRLAHGMGFQCAFDISGTAECWGSNTFGQLGNGNPVAAALPPQAVNGPAFTSIAMGNAHACGITSDGTAYCWGWNGHGQLGDGTTTNRSIPTAVLGGLRFKSIAAAAFHSCGLTLAGDAYCWGDDEAAQLGSLTGPLDDPRAVTTPKPVSGGLVFASIATGGSASCGLTTGGAAYCWGSAFFGQLGNGTSGNGPPGNTANLWFAPVAVSGSYTFSQISVGDQHTCGLTTDARAYCWGENVLGQIGTGSTLPSVFSTPAPVSALFTFTQISAGTGHTCGIATGGSLYCWGSNSAGELGDGTTTNRSLPTLVTFP
jgi:alpha-tubulin suppressor-like RCC1 family protein